METEANRELDGRVAKSRTTRQRILETATNLFLTQGYSNTSLEEVAAQAEVTKPTVYSHFESKQGLFDAVVQECASHRLKELAPFLEPTDDPRQDLIRIGDLLLTRILDKENLRWDRLAAVESMNHPEIGEAFFNAGPAQVFKRLANYFKAQTKASRLKIDNPHDVAELFIGMVVALDVLKTQIGQAPASPAKRKRRCRQAVEVLMNTYGTAGENKQ